MRVEIDCINKNNRQSRYERIERVGGPNGDGTRWNLPLDDAIAGWERGEWDFFVRQGSHEVVGVHVAVSAQGRKFLRTDADHDTPDNLLSLDECR